MRSLFIILFGLLIVGCQTTSKVPAHLQNKYASIIQSSCVIGTQTHAYDANFHNTVGNDVVVFEVVYGERSWVRIDAALSGLRDNMYYSLNSKQLYCNANSWLSLRIPFIPLSNQVSAANNDHGGISYGTQKYGVESYQDRQLCMMATTKGKWDEDPRSKVHLDGAKARGLTLQKCNELIGN